VRVLCGTLALGAEQKLSTRILDSPLLSILLHLRSRFPVIYRRACQLIKVSTRIFPTHSPSHPSRLSPISHSRFPKLLLSIPGTIVFPTPHQPNTVIDPAPSHEPLASIISSPFNLQPSPLVGLPQPLNKHHSHRLFSWGVTPESVFEKKASSVAFFCSCGRGW